MFWPNTRNGLYDLFDLACIALGFERVFQADALNATIGNCGLTAASDTRSSRRELALIQQRGNTT